MEKFGNPWPTRLYVLLKCSQPYPSGCFSPIIRGTVSFSTDRHSSTLQVAADMTISLSSGTCRCQTHWCSLVRAALCAV